MTENSEPYKKKAIYIPFEDTYKDPVVDLFYLFRIMWRGKWFMLSICLIFTLIATIMIFIPNYESSAKVNIGKDAILNIENYLGSFSIKKKILEELNLGSDHIKSEADSPSEDMSEFDIEYVDSHFWYKVDEKKEVLTMFWKSKQQDLSVKMMEKILSILQDYISKELENENTARYRMYRDKFEPVSEQLEKIVNHYNTLENLSDAQIIFMHQYLAMKNKLIDYETIEKIQRNYIILEPAKLLIPGKSKKLGKIFMAFLFSMIFAIVIVLIHDIYRRSISSQINK